MGRSGLARMPLDGRRRQDHPPPATEPPAEADPPMAGGAARGGGGPSGPPRARGVPGRPRPGGRSGARRQRGVAPPLQDRSRWRRHLQPDRPRFDQRHPRQWRPRRPDDPPRTGPYRGRPGGPPVLHLRRRPPRGDAPPAARPQPAPARGGEARVSGADQCRDRGDPRDRRADGDQPPRPHLHAPRHRLALGPGDGPGQARACVTSLPPALLSWSWSRDTGCPGPSPRCCRTCGCAYGSMSCCCSVLRGEYEGYAIRADPSRAPM